MMAVMTTTAFAQYTKVSCARFPKAMDIVQIDYRESSTIVFLKYICQEGVTWSNIGEKTIAKIEGDYKQYHLINSINMPINTEAENRYMIFDNVGQTHYFALEFERMPEDKAFNIIEDESNPNAYNFYSVLADTITKDNFMNIDDFVSSTPVKEMGRFMKDGTVITYVKYNNIIVTTYAYAIKEYGKYQINMDIQNLSGKSILFDLENVTAEGFVVQEGQPVKTFPMEILSAYEYDKKVKRKQSWNNFWVALGEGMAASNAGYSSSSTTYSGNSCSSVYGHASGYVGNTYGYANAYGSAYTTTYGRANTTTYNGAAAYAAQQQANANYQAYANSQYQVRQQLCEGYVKNNTIRNEVEYSGFFNIKYKKLDHIQIESYSGGRKELPSIFTIPIFPFLAPIDIGLSSKRSTYCQPINRVVFSIPLILYL